jgi:hypothetical protein
MLNQSYSIQKFSENLSQTNTTKQLIELIQSHPNLDLYVDFRVVEGCWYVRDDMFSPCTKLMLMPKLLINGESIDKPWHPVKVDGMQSLQADFLRGLKEAF